MTITATRLFAFDNQYARLPERFHARQNPTPVSRPHLLCLNEPLARLLGADPAMLMSSAGIAALAGNQVPQGAEPLAMAYAGHQFGRFVPQLGDGRALLLGEVTGADGIRRDIQLKGAGRTRFSRGGDGRAAIGPSLREYIVSEAMAALGIPTTRSLAVVATGDRVMREAAFPGAVLTRIARSHLRVGTFQFFASRGDIEGLRILADHAITRLYPQARDRTAPYRAFLDGVIAASARLVARWLSVGFIHGVMNTDNMSISGETIDYGPCAFLDGYDPGKTFSSIDQAGRYAYANQPRIAHWNLTRLAECLLPLLADDEDAAIEQARQSLDAYPAAFEAAYLDAFRAKLGLREPREGDAGLIQALLTGMAENQADFTLTFRGLGTHAVAVRDMFANPAAFDAWEVEWRARLASEAVSPEARQTAMNAVNPAYIPRNHQVQAALAAAEQDGDLAPLQALNKVLAQPFTDQPGCDRYARGPLPDEIVHATFCGT